MREKLWARKPFSVNDLVCDESGNPVKTEIDSWLIEVKAYIEALEAELEKANQLSIKLALQKGGMVDEARTLKAERDRFKQREIELSKGWKRLYSENEDLKSRLAEAEVFRNYLIALGHLNEDEDAYFCAYEEDCKECAEKDWAVCLGYNVKLAAEKAETSLRGEAEG
jgi:hypothetical protein